MQGIGDFANFVAGAVFCGRYKNVSRRVSFAGLNLEVQISGQVQHFINLDMQISSQTQHFVNLNVQIS